MSGFSDIDYCRTPRTDPLTGLVSLDGLVVIRPGALILSFVSREDPNSRQQYRFASPEGVEAPVEWAIAGTLTAGSLKDLEGQRNFQLEFVETGSLIRIRFADNSAVVTAPLPGFPPPPSTSGVWRQSLWTGWPGPGQPLMGELMGQGFWEAA